MFFAYQRLDGCSGHEMGRVLLARLYREATGQDCPQVCRDGLGKPYFPGSSWHFSISHTKTHAFCILADHPVGIDAEPIGRAVRPELIRRYLSGSEQTRLGAAPADAALRLWVLKEATGKCRGIGIGNWMQTTDFDPFDPKIQCIDGCYVAIVEEYHAV